MEVLDGPVKVKWMVLCCTGSLNPAITPVLAAMPVALGEGVCEITTGTLEPAATMIIAVVPVRPAADAEIVAVPAAVARKVDVAMPAVGARGRPD